jgi:hypothetical protein
MEDSFMETGELIDFLYRNRSEIPPKNPERGQLFMNLQSEIFVFLENEWIKTEAIKIENHPNNYSFLNEIVF